jgi:hypothetical protein
MKTFTNPNAAALCNSTECSVLVACVGETSPTSGEWIEVECKLEAEILIEGLSHLYRQNGRTFYGHR